VDGSYNTFELTIRLLGGLLSAHWAEWELGITPGLHPVLKTQGIKEDEWTIGSEDEGYYDPQDLLYLHKAVDLADRLSAAFETRSGLPLSNVNLMRRKGEASDQENGLVSTAEVGTLQLEFR
jgi:endoplasmic reticulum Man9GlcNAc2 1,2-alpha-mannosidase